MYKKLANSVFVGKNIKHVPSCHSTNALAEQLLADEKTHEGLVVIADHQTKGKGQKDKLWVSEAGKNLTFSVILKPSFLALDEQFYLNIITSLAVSNTIRELVAEEIKVKWPNDIIIGKKKIAGILIKNILNNRQINATIIGIGLNVNQENFSMDTAISLFNLLQKKTELASLFELILMNLEYNYLKLRKGELTWLRNEYLDSLYWLNEQHTFDAGERFAGRILGINETGRLIVESQKGILLFDNSEIVYCN